LNSHIFQKTPENAKVVIAQAVKQIPNSVKLWMYAASLETEVKAKKRVLRKGTKRKLFLPVFAFLFSFSFSLSLSFSFCLSKGCKNGLKNKFVPIFYLYLFFLCRFGEHPKCCPFMESGGRVGGTRRCPYSLESCCRVCSHSPLIFVCFVPLFFTLPMLIF
jgi:hypothetical protein